MSPALAAYIAGVVECYRCHLAGTTQTAEFLNLRSATDDLWYTLDDADKAIATIADEAFSAALPGAP